MVHTAKMKTQTLRQLGGDYAVARLAADSPIPDWADGEGFVSISRTDEELSITCLAARVPANAQSSGPWRCFKLQGPFAFDEYGILLAIVRPLSEAGLGVYVVSSYDTDHLLLLQSVAERGIELLEAAGHRVLR
ncbi:ACT domain-containing protein [Uliginosibacterium sp. TH139]|uniref:ACT domain-containing protein n=1 Tax=Uliginosibacterium sp. TH139 TaxID=2067453 RepID=UPI0020B15A03|nr:ACT domain-containing protein [Uliginosibacterium sp. TH139]